MKIGDIVYGKVTNILGYGAFVLVEEYDGLIHISEFSDHFVRDIKEFVNIGDEVKLSDRKVVLFHFTEDELNRDVEFPAGVRPSHLCLISTSKDYERDPKLPPRICR